MQTLIVQIIKLPHAYDLPDPAYQTPGSSGFDLRAAIDEDIFVYPGEKRIIPTGLKMKVPNGYECQIRSRSGLAAKNGIYVLNSPGTIDADYREEVFVIIQSTDQNFIIKRGDRIAQAVICPVVQADLYFVGELDKTERTGGLGSTGIK